MDENLKILIDKNLIIEEEEDKDKKYLIYNGVNHDIELYYNSNDYKANRNIDKKYYITNVDTKYTNEYKQSIPLSVYENKKEAVLGSELSSIKFNDQIIEILSNYYYYDMIIVSKRYADKACELLSGDAKYHDYLDRLYMPVKAYDHDASKVKDVKVIGCIDFNKVWYYDERFWLSIYYETIRDINDGKLKNLPSKKAVYDSIRRAEIMGLHRDIITVLRKSYAMERLKGYCQYN